MSSEGAAGGGSWEGGEEADSGSHIPVQATLLLVPVQEDVAEHVTMRPRPTPTGSTPVSPFALGFDIESEGGEHETPTPTSSSAGATSTSLLELSPISSLQQAEKLSPPINFTDTTSSSPSEEERKEKAAEEKMKEEAQRQLLAMEPLSGVVYLEIQQRSREQRQKEQEQQKLTSDARSSTDLLIFSPPEAISIVGNDVDMALLIGGSSGVCSGGEKESEEEQLLHISSYYTPPLFASSFGAALATPFGASGKAQFNVFDSPLLPAVGKTGGGGGGGGGEGNTTRVVGGGEDGVENLLVLVSPGPSSSPTLHALTPDIFATPTPEKKGGKVEAAAAASPQASAAAAPPTTVSLSSVKEEEEEEEEAEEAEVALAFASSSAQAAASPGPGFFFKVGDIVTINVTELIKLKDIDKRLVKRNHDRSKNLTPHSNMEGEILEIKGRKFLIKWYSPKEVEGVPPKWHAYDHFRPIK